MFYLLRFFLFRFQAEKAHHLTAGLLKALLKVPGLCYVWKTYYTVNHPLLETEVAGLKFANPVGLGAGFDKNAVMVHEMEACGFGFIEIGTLTPLAQPGNPKPRLFRLIKDEAIINRMGFNNDGVDEAVKHLRRRKTRVLIGGNIGKNKNTPNQAAENDYLIAFEKLQAHVDYFVVNVSSPNTPNLRELQEKEPLKNLLHLLMKKAQEIKSKQPIFLKIAPDLTNEQLDDIVEIVLETNIAGVIATNTTISRDGLKSLPAEVDAIGAGGLSGKPLSKRSTEVLRYIASKGENRFAIIGIGGIHSVQDALDKLDAGADLVQLYTGFVYEGPRLVRDINRAILKRRLQQQYGKC